MTMNDTPSLPAGEARAASSGSAPRLVAQAARALLWGTMSRMLGRRASLPSVYLNDGRRGGAA